ncbi:DUF3108 domain-containing protein [Pseudoxanthomonas suwonensis]|uniref:DUF3108 domain-containing protein n=1 Tax=Pseudoxanthomonas suwonensis TaxID=314722 RepID=UPI0004656A73|nr:DUF3108 domain-containing protein [Pseudoxanthomonas suwonensis]
MLGRIRFRYAPWLAVLLALAATTAQAASLEPFTADYQASYLGMQATGTMSLAPEGGNRWKYSLAIRNQVADVSQNTVFDEHQGRLRPLSSSDHSAAVFKKKNVDATYDWKAGTATWSGDVKPERRGPVKLQPGDMDALLINLAVVRDLAAGRPLKYRMVDEGRVREMEWEVVGKEAVTVGGASKQATKLVRRTDKREMLVWIVPELPVPARVLQRENGMDTINLVLRSVH